MALEGTLDTFALPDVIRLLAATAKTGCLRVSGDRGGGRTWFVDGAIVAVDADHAPHALEPSEALYELLRLTRGDFLYEADVADRPGSPVDAESLLASAEVLLAEWREIEAVVPSLDSWVTLRRHLDAAEVTIDREHWTTLVAIGSGTTVQDLGDQLALAELPVSRAVKALVETGLVEIEVRPPAPRSRPARRPVEPVATVATPAVAPPPSGAAGVDLDLFADDPSELDATTQGLAAAFPGLASHTAPASHDDDEVARHLASLPPQAALAVRAAAAAETEEERDAALAEAEENGASLNRGLLLKFLSSVKT